MSNKKDLAQSLGNTLDNTLLGESREKRVSEVQKLEETLSPEARKAFEASRSAKKGPGRPKKEIVDDTFFRTTIIAHRRNYEKIKVIAMKEGMSFKDVLNEALSAAVEKYEEKNGEVILRDNRENLFK